MGSIDCKILRCNSTFAYIRDSSWVSDCNTFSALIKWSFVCCRVCCGVCYGKILSYINKIIKILNVLTLDLLEIAPFIMVT